MAAQMQDGMQSDGVPVGRESEQQGSPEGEIGALVQNIGGGMMTFAKIASEAGAPPSAIQKIEASMQMFQDAISEIQGAPEGGEPQGGGRAVPMQSPEGRPMGPQGV